MEKIGKLTQSDTKRYNRNRVFQFIYNQKTLSRQDIADGLNLSLPTVNQNIKELFDLGYIDYAGNFQSTGGRKPQAIMVPGDIKYAISINVRRKCILASLINVYGVMCCTREYDELFSTQADYRRLLGTIANEMAEYAKCNKQDILGVGITIPGIIDKENAVIVSAPTLKIRNYPLASFTEFISYPCHVENDARSFAYAQMWKNKNYEKKIYLLVDKGVGGSMITGNEAAVSKENRTGEFGHMIIHPDGKQCDCGRQGCLEAYVSTAVLSDDMGIYISDFFNGLKNNIGYNKILNQYLNDLALGINNIATIYDAPVVIGGEIVKYLEPYMEQLMGNIMQYDAGFVGSINVELSTCDKEESLIGAALVYIDKFIENV